MLGATLSFVLKDQASCKASTSLVLGEGFGSYPMVLGVICLFAQGSLLEMLQGQCTARAQTGNHHIPSMHLEPKKFKTKVHKLGVSQQWMECMAAMCEVLDSTPSPAKINR